MEDEMGVCPWEEMEEADPDILREDRDERRRLERDVCECAAFTGQDVRGQAGMLPRDRTLHARTRAGSDPAIHGCRGGIPESTMQRTVRPGSGIYPPGPGRPPA